jgi:hypothetical protein
VIAGTLLQFVGALYVRAYARACWVREMREEEVFLRGCIEERTRFEDEEGRGERRLSVIREEEDFGGEKM